jgi:hypothetical protein
MIGASAFDHAEVARTAGPTPLTVRVRTVNEFGAPVTTGQVTVSVDGEDQTLDVDAYGLAELVLEAPGRHTVALQDGQSVAVDVYQQGWSGLGVDRVWPGHGPAIHAARLSDGYLVATSTELWWQSDAGVSERMLSLPISGALEGVRVGELDADDRIDVVAWSADTLFFLRGVPAGGLAWAGGLRLADGELGGASVEDVDGDGLLDLGLGVILGEEAHVELLVADGLFGYTLARHIPLLHPPHSISLGTDATTGRQRLVAIGDETWEWLQESEEGHYEVFSSDPPFELPADARLVDGGDFTGDRVDDTWVMGPRVEGQNRIIQVVDLEAQPITYVTRNHLAAHATIQDAGGDGHDDLWTLDGAYTLRVLTGADGVQEERGLGTLAAYGPIVPADVIGDEHDDLLLAGSELLYRYTGGVSDSGNWRPAVEGLDNLLADLLRVHQVRDVDEDPTTADWSGIQVREDVVWAKSWSRGAAATTVIEQQRFRVTDGADQFVDAAWCGDNLWVLTRDRLLRLALDADLTEGASAQVVASRVACWEGGAVVLRAGEVDLYDLAGSLQDTLQTPNAQDVAVGADGLGGPLVETCDTTACSIVVWSGPWGTAFVRAGASESTFDGVPLGVHGAPNLADVDGDGLDDLLTVDPVGRIAVVRATPDGAGQPEIFFLRRGLSGDLTVVDADADGVMDLLAIDEEGRLFLAPSPAP